MEENLLELSPEVAQSTHVHDCFAKAESFTRDLDIKQVGLYPYFKVISDNAGPHVTIDGREVIMGGSNNYLGLTRDPRVLAAANEAQARFGTSCSGSRYANGTYTLHVDLEEQLADWMGKETALCFTTGYTANLGAISSLADRHDIIFSDKENHSCIMDATALTFAKTKRYAHDDMEDLERALEETPKRLGRLIVSDGVFSMRGTVANIPKMVELKKKYGARIYIDDAHGLGVIGARGRGTAEHYGLHDEVDVIMGTFSKSFAGLGGFVCGDERVISFIKHTARSLIFAAAMTPASTAAVLKTLELIQSEPEHLANLWSVTKKARRGFKDLGFDIDTEGPTPILYIRAGEDMHAFGFWKALFEAGVYTNPVVTPGVPAGWSGVRVSFMATHSDQDLARMFEIFERVGKQFKLIS